IVRFVAGRDARTGDQVVDRLGGLERAGRGVLSLAGLAPAMGSDDVTIAEQFQRGAGTQSRDSERRRADLERALGLAETRERREAERERARAAIDEAEALRAETSTRLQRAFGASAVGQGRA